ncbi:DoxX family protein [Sinomicrobium sp. M5D2P17]
MQKKNSSGLLKWSYYIATLLFTLIIVFSVGNYLFNNDFIREGFIKMGYPTYIIYPLAAIKILGLVVIWSRKHNLLYGLAYAGFFYNCILAAFAHLMISDNGQWFAVVALILIVISYFMSKQLPINTSNKGALSEKRDRV